MLGSIFCTMVSRDRDSGTESRADRRDLPEASGKAAGTIRSAARGDFQPAQSDVDFLVEFQSYDSPTIADQWSSLQEDLESLLGHKVEQLLSGRNV